MTPAYSTYTSYTTDGTDIYTSVSVSGTTNGTCPFGCGICNSTTHMGVAYNVLGGVGGDQSGNRVPWNGYVSAVNNQQIAATEGTEYTFTSSAEVICSAIGTIYSVASVNDYVSIKETYGKLAGQTVVGDTRFCSYALACSNNVTPACAQQGWVMATSPSLNCYGYARSTWLAVRTSKTSPFNCFPGATFDASGPGKCDQ